MSGDPLVGGVLGIFNNGSELAWFKSFLYLEACVYPYTSNGPFRPESLFLLLLPQPVSTPGFRNRCLWPLER